MDAKKAVLCLQGYVPFTYDERQEATKLAIEALEKQVPKKATHKQGGCEFDCFGNEMFCGYCPCCGKTQRSILNNVPPRDQYRVVKYCDECGQRLDWSDNHDTQA